jgi:hypothetical protein
MTDEITTVTEHHILEALRRVPRRDWLDVLGFLHKLGGGDPHFATLADSIWTAAELQKLPREQQDAVLHEQAARLVAAYRADPKFISSHWWKGAELSYLPREQRGIIMEASALVAEDEYRNNPELTAFEAFGEDDLYVDSHLTEPR